MAPISNKTKEELYIKNLQDIKEIFDWHRIEFWLDTGTLLGAVREGKILSWDDDVDLSLKEVEYRKLPSTFAEFKERGFIINEVPVPLSDLGKSYRRFSLSRSGYIIDIFSYFLKDNDWLSFVSSWNFGQSLLMKVYSKILWFVWRILCSAEINFQSKIKRFFGNIIKFLLILLPNNFKRFLFNKTGKKLRQLTVILVIPRHHFENLEKIKYYDMDFNVPADTENYLNYRYGKDWRTPKNNWNWVKDDGSVKPYLRS